MQQSEEFMERIRLEKESALVNRLGNGMDSCKSKDELREKAQQIQTLYVL